jgi:hypothetical protein
MLILFSMVGFTQAQGLPTLPVVKGTVTLDGTPVPYFTVILSASDTTTGIPFLPIMTDEEGFYQHNLVPGTFTVAIYDTFSYEPFETEIILEMGDTATVDIALVLRDFDATVTGDVTFEGKGQSGVWVYFFYIGDFLDLDDFLDVETHFDPLIHPEEWASYKVQTDDQGNFSLDMMNGKYIVYVPGSETLLPAWTAVEVPTTEPLHIILKEKKTISGTVTNFELYKWVSISGFSMNSGRPYTVELDSMGKYSMEVAPGDYVIQLKAYYEDNGEFFMYVEYYNEDPAITAHLPKDASQVSVQDDVEGIDFVLPEPGVKSFTISGTVTSGQDPLEGAMVSFVSYNFASNLYISYSATTDDKGQYSILGRTILEEDSLIGFAAKDGYLAEFYEDEATFMTADPIVYHPDDNLTIDFDLTMIDPDAGFSIYGSVVDTAGNPVPYGQITAFSTDLNVGIATTEIDSNGYYAFDSIFVDGSTIYLQAWAGYEYMPSIYDGKDSWDQADAIVIAGDNFQADFVLQKKEDRRFWLGEITGWIDPGFGKVTGSDQYEGDMVYIKRTGTDTWQEVDYVDENGNFALPFETSSESSISYDLKWTSKEHGDQETTVSVDAGSQEANVTLKLTSIETDRDPVIRSNRLFDAYPNPFNPATKIQVDLMSTQKVSLVVYDVTGRQVKTLYNGILEAGSKTLTWNGQDDNGRIVSSGIYFYQLKTAEFVKTKSVIFLK